MTQKRISVIIPVRNRAGLRLSRCLASLRGQELKAEAVEIIVSDFGSDADHADALRALCATYDCVYLRTDTRALWNRSRAINIGVQRATGAHVLSTDVDMLFAPNFLQVVSAELLKGNAFVVCRCRDLPQDTVDGDWSPAAYDTLSARSTFRKFPGTGACQAVRRDWLVSVRGYDEKYVYWGYEDRDMFLRAKRAGLDIVWIHEKTSMLHQWHKKMDNDRVLLRHKNRLRYFLTGFIVKKNPGGWGFASDM